MSITRLFQIVVLCLLATGPEANAANLIFSRGTDFFDLDTQSGAERFLATGSLDTPVNFSLEVNGPVAYQGGRIGGQYAISATNLATGATRDYIAPGGFFSSVAGFHNGEIVLTRGSDYYALNLDSGIESFLARGSLDTPVNHSFEIQGSVVYHGGTIGGQHAVSATDLTTGITRDYIAPGGFFGHFGGFFNDDLVLVRDTDFYALDLTTGRETYLATSSLEVAVNRSWEIDGDIAYQGGRIGSQYAVSATNLVTGDTRDYIMPGGFFNNFGGFYTIPEPTIFSSLLAGLVVLSLRRKRNPQHAQD